MNYKKIRTKAGLSQQEVASMCNTKQAYVSMFERGQKEVLGLPEFYSALKVSSNDWYYVLPLWFVTLGLLAAFYL